MPRNGSGTYTKPSGTTFTANTTILSAKVNEVIDDLVTDANTARPVVAGGTEAATAAGARTNLELDKKLVFSSKSAGYTAVAADNNAALRFTGAYTLALTAAATLAANWHITVIADGGAVTVDPDASETINGAATLTIADGSAAFIFCTGATFYARVIQPYDALLADIAALTITEGAIIYGVGTDNVSVLAKGTAAQVLAMNAGATAPEWVTGPATVKISSKTVSTSVTEVDFTSIPTGYSKFILIAKNVVTDEAANSSTVMLRTSTDNGTNFTSGASSYYNNTTAANNLLSFAVPGNSSTFKYHHSEITILGLGDVASATTAFSMGNSRGVTSSGITMAVPTTGNTRAAAELDNAIRCTVGGGVNFTAGTFILYGVKE